MTDHKKPELPEPVAFRWRDPRNSDYGRWRNSKTESEDTVLSDALYSECVIEHAYSEESLLAYAEEYARAQAAGVEGWSVVRNGVAVFVRCADEYIAALEALTAIREDGPPLVERKPTKDPDAYSAWMRLNGATARMKECVEKLRPLTAAPAPAEAKPAEGGGWRPITTPHEAEVVLLCDKHGNRWTDVYPGEAWQSNGCGLPPIVFMPLPAPPEFSDEQSSIVKKGA